MKIKPPTLRKLLVCAILAFVSLVAGETLSHLGSAYWLLLWALALSHVVVSTAVIIISPEKRLVAVIVLVLLVMGQWRAIEMIAMLTIWSLRGFAP